MYINPMELKFEGMQIGSLIKAFDFEPMEGREPCYIEGVIIDTVWYQNAKCYKVRCTKEVWRGKEKEEVYPYGKKGGIIMVPMEIGYMDWEDRITVVRGDEDH